MNASSLRWFTPVALLVVACGVYRFTLAAGERPAVVPPKLLPNEILPRYDLPLVASDEQLHAVLGRMKPPAGPPDTNDYVHALRLWGPHAEFGNSDHPSGQTMLAYYLDDHAFRRLAGDDAPPLFSIDDEGIQVRAWNEIEAFQATGAVHVDDLLATLAESGVPLDTKMITRDGEATVRDLLDRAMGRFNRQQHEYEWSAISYARYVYPALEWRNKYGQRITVDELVDELIEQDPHNGICGGTHRLEALVVLNRADELHGMLPRRTKRKLLDHLQTMSRMLVASQYADGSWAKNWPQGAAAHAGPAASIDEKILVTGHHLEWLALAPPEILPPRETIVRAGQWIVRTMLELEDTEIAAHYGPFTHSARALSLWRGKQPFEAWQAGNHESHE